MDAAHKWDDFYASDSRESFLHFTDDQVSSILKDFPLAKTALDIGCGEGQLMLQLEATGVTTTGIDLSKVALAEAHKHVKGNLIEGDFEKFDFPIEQKFDLIFVKFVIAFIESKPAFFKKVRGLLNAGGALILLTPVIDGEIVQKLESESIFVEKSVLDTYMPKYFPNIKEEILHAERAKKLSLFICKN